MQLLTIQCTLGDSLHLPYLFIYAIYDTKESAFESISSVSTLTSYLTILIFSLLARTKWVVICSESLWWPILSVSQLPLESNAWLLLSLMLFLNCHFVREVIFALHKENYFVETFHLWIFSQISYTSFQCSNNRYQDRSCNLLSHSAAICPLMFLCCICLSFELGQ